MLRTICLTFLAMAIVYQPLIFAQNPAPPMSPVKQKKAAPMRLELKDGSVLVGKIESPTPITLKTEVGEVRIPWSKLRSVCAAAPQGKKWRAVLHNGDVMSGEVKLPPLKLRAAWGEVNVPSEHLLSIATSPPLLTTPKTAFTRRRIYETLPNGETRARTVLVPEPNGPYRPSTPRRHGPVISPPSYSPSPLPAPGAAPSYGPPRRSPPPPPAPTTIAPVPSTLPPKSS